MPTPTYKPLATKTLTTTASSITFSSISQSFRDLIIVCNSAVSTSTANLYLQFNGDSASNYYFVTMYGSGGGSGVSQYVNTAVMYAGYGNIDLDTSFAGIHQINVMDYSATDKHKSVLFRTNNATSQTHAAAGRWASTAAISSIVIKPTASTFAANSTFTLYGIVA